MRRFFTGIIILVVVCSIFADTITLLDGKQIKGKLLTDKEGMTGLETDLNVRVYFPSSMVMKIEKDISPYEEYLRLKKEDADEMAKERYVRKNLVNWCKESGLKNAYRVELVALAIYDSKNGVDDQDVSKQMGDFGYVWDYDDKKWLTKDDANRKKGLVWFDGRWMTPADKKLILEMRNNDNKKNAGKKFAALRCVDDLKTKLVSKKICPLCSGTGQRGGFNVSGPCPLCKGTGYVNYEK